MANTSNWPTAIFEQYVDLLAGFAFKSSQFIDDPDGITLIKGADVQQGYIEWDGCKRWPKSACQNLDRFWLHEGDVLLAMDRPWVPSGLKWAWIKKDSPKSLLVQRVARLRGKSGLLTDYIRYLVGSPMFTDYISPIVTGVNVPHISGNQILGFPFLLPPLPTQRKIAAILSAYDDLIENNLRRIKILEEMAQNLYREWFVKFRFPGHEQAYFVDSVLGRIPEGWEVVELGSVADVRWGDTSTTKKSYVDKGYLAFSAAGADGNLDHFDYDRVGIVLSAIGANCGQTWYVKGKWSCIKNTIRLWATDSRTSTEYLYFATMGHEFWPKRGAAQPFISQGDANNILIIVPNRIISERFENIAGLILSQTMSLADKNATLRRTRDLLLPKLISGEVDVSELDIAIPEEAVL